MLAGVPAGVGPRADDLSTATGAAWRWLWVRFFDRVFRRGILDQTSAEIELQLLIAIGPAGSPTMENSNRLLGDAAGRMRPASAGERTERGSRLKGRRWVRKSLRRGSSCRRVEGVQYRAACGDQRHGKQDGQVPRDGSAAQLASKCGLCDQPTLPRADGATLRLDQDDRRSLTRQGARIGQRTANISSR